MTEEDEGAEGEEIEEKEVTATASAGVEGGLAVEVEAELPVSAICINPVGSLPRPSS